MKDPIATPERRAAAARLVEIIALHGNPLHRLGYNRQIGEMTALTADLAKPAPTAVKVFGTRKAPTSPAARDDRGAPGGILAVE